MKKAVVICLLLSVVMLACMLVGCAGNRSNADVTGTQEQTGQTTTNGENAAEQNAAGQLPDDTMPQSSGEADGTKTEEQTTAGEIPEDPTQTTVSDTTSKPTVVATTPEEPTNPVVDHTTTFDLSDLPTGENDMGWG